MNNLEILRIAMEQSAADISCSAEDFEKDENIVVPGNPRNGCFGTDGAACV